MINFTKLKLNLNLMMKTTNGKYLFLYLKEEKLNCQNYQKLKLNSS